MKTTLAKTSEKVSIFDSTEHRVDTRRIKATESGSVVGYNGSDYYIISIDKGELGGRVQVDEDGHSAVALTNGAWLGRDAIATDNSRIAGVICDYSRVIKSNIGKGTVLAGRASVVNSDIRNNVLIYGTVRIENCGVGSGSIIIGSGVIRDCDFGKNVTVRAPGTMEHHNLKDGEFYTNPKELIAPPK